jgi:predicted DNA-binding protein with PD1-like motif
MKYKVGRPGKIIIAKFDDREDVLENLLKVAKKERLKAAVFFVVGGLRKGSIVVGPEKDKIPPKPVWRQLEKSHEVVGIGTIFWEKNTPKIHFHGAFGKKSSAKIGCLRKGAETFLILEVIIIEIKGIKASRDFDPQSGLTLLKL